MMFTPGGGEPGSLSSSRSSSFRRPSNIHTPDRATPPPTNRRVDSLRGPSAPSPLVRTHTPIQAHTPIPSAFTPPPRRITTEGDHVISGPGRPPSPSALNRLQARVIRAKLMGTPDAEALQKEYDELAQGQGAGGQGVGGKVTQVEMVPTLDARGQLYDYGTATPTKEDVAESLPGNGRRKKKEEQVRYVLCSHAFYLTSTHPELCAVPIPRPQNRRSTPVQRL